MEEGGERGLSYELKRAMLASAAERSLVDVSLAVERPLSAGEGSEEAMVIAFQLRSWVVENG